jgi:hypothetical protein
MTFTQKKDSLDLSVVNDSKKESEIKALLSRIEKAHAQNAETADVALDGLIAKLVEKYPGIVKGKTITKAEVKKSVAKLQRLKNIVPKKVDKDRLVAQIKKQHPRYTDKQATDLANLRIQAQVDRADGITKMINTLSNSSFYSASELSNAGIDPVSYRPTSPQKRDRDLPKDAQIGAITERQEVQKFKRKSPTFGKPGGAKLKYYYEYRMNRRDVDDKILLENGGSIKGSNSSTGEKYGVVLGSKKKSNEYIKNGTEINVRKSYSSRVSEVKLIFDENNNLYEIIDYGSSIDGYPNTSQGSGRKYNADKKETKKILSEMFNASFATKLVDHISNKMEDGGVVGQEIVFDYQGDENKGVIKEIHENTGDYIVTSEDGRTLLVQRDRDVISLGEMRKKPMETEKKKRFAFFNKGGSVNENKEMLQNQSKQVSHHADELENVLKHKLEVEPWVIAKMGRATSDLSDVTHYLDGEQSKEYSKPIYKNGGAVEITSPRKNIMGTLSFSMKFGGMRKPQEFIVYPVSSESDVIRIQSDTRFGIIGMKNGNGLMSQSHASGAYGHHMSTDKLTPFSLTDAQLEELKEMLANTAGKSVGSSIVKTDNSGANKFNKGGGIKVKPVTYYVAYTSYFDTNKYDEDKITKALESIGASDIHLENEDGQSNQPEVVVFKYAGDGTDYDPTKAVQKAFDTDWIIVRVKDWRTKKMANGGGVDGWKKGQTIPRETKAEAEKNKRLLKENYGEGGRNFKIEKDSNNKYIITYEFNLSDKKMANGGGVNVSSQADYVSKRNIDKVEYKKDGSKRTVTGKDLLDGIYINKNVKFTPKAKRVTLAQLTKAEESVWDEQNWQSGSEIRRNTQTVSKYANLLASKIKALGVQKGSLPNTVFDKLEDENYHLLNEFLAVNGYFKNDYDKYYPESSYKEYKKYKKTDMIVK